MSRLDYHKKELLMKITVKIAITCLCVLLLHSCIKSSGTTYQNIQRQAKADNCEIEVYDQGNVPKPYKIIGMVKAESGWGDKANIERLKKEACQLGGDGLLDIELRTPDRGIIYGSSDPVPQIDLWVAKVVVFTKN